jgi:hypothetical protein
MTCAAPLPPFMAARNNFWRAPPTPLRTFGDAPKITAQNKLGLIMHIMSVFAAAGFAAVFAVTLPASAADTAQQGTMKTCAASWSAKAAPDKASTTYKAYMSTCMKSPTTAAAPAPAMAMKAAAPAGGGSAKCKDGKTVTYKNRMGTCSGHGGVATWL